MVGYEALDSIVDEVFYYPPDEGIVQPFVMPPHLSGLTDLVSQRAAEMAGPGADEERLTRAHWIVLSQYERLIGIQTAVHELARRVTEQAVLTKPVSPEVFPNLTDR